MAGLLSTMTTSAVSLSAATAKTAIQVQAPTNQRLKILAMKFHHDGTSATEAPVKVRILVQSTAGTMSAGAPVKYNAGDDETLQADFTENATAEPTAGAVMRTLRYHPQVGYAEQFPPGRELIVPGGTRLGFEFTDPSASHSVIVELLVEE